MTRIWQLGRSLTFRLTLIYLALFITSVGILITFDYWYSIHRPLRLAKEMVSSEMRDHATTYIVDGKAALLSSLQARDEQHQTRKAFFAFIDKDGRLKGGNLPSWPKETAPDWLRIEADIYKNGDEEDHEALLLDRHFDDGARLLLGRDIEDIDEREEWLADILLWGANAAIFLGLLGGIFMSFAVGRRIERINRAARHVIAGDLSGRVPVNGSKDDFDRLSETLNLMLARIEASMESIRRVSDSIAHELRTPLTRLLVNLEELAAAKPDGPQHPELISQAIEETRRLQSVFDSLLRIARLETGRHVTEQRRIDINKLLEDAVELYQPEAEKRQQSLVLRASSPPLINTDPDLVFQAVSNLIDNAIKYTPATGAITVQALAEDSQIVIRISDSGQGIPAPLRDRVTERFYRAPDMGGVPGVGLGLSFVEAVAKAHGGSIRFTDVPQGFAVDLILPAGPASPASSQA